MDSSLSGYFESKLKEKPGLSSTMRNKLLQAYSKDKKLLKRMTSRHVEEETKGCDLASFTEAQELGEKELAHVDSIIENTKPEKMVDIDEDDEGNMKRERMMTMLKKFDLSSEWETQVRSRYEMDHWFAKAGSYPKNVDDKVELEEVLAQGRVPADSNLLSFQGASAKIVGTQELVGEADSKRQSRSLHLYHLFDVFVPLGNFFLLMCYFFGDFHAHNRPVFWQVMHVAEKAGPGQRRFTSVAAWS